MVVLLRLKGIFFGRYLWVTNTVSGGVLLAAGDAIQQNIERTNTNRNSTKKHHYDLERSGRMAMIGLGLGLPHHFWYSFLDRILPGTRLLTIAGKIMLDQAAFSPFANFFFFMGSGVLEGHSVQQSWKEFETKFPMVYKTDCSFWPPAQFVNFMFVPPALRVVYVNVFTIAWNVFLSYAKYFDKVAVVSEPELCKSVIPL